MDRLITFFQHLFADASGWLQSAIHTPGIAKYLLFIVFGGALFVYLYKEAK